MHGPDGAAAQNEDKIIPADGAVALAVQTAGQRLGEGKKRAVGVGGQQVKST